MAKYIDVKGARTHNLQNITVSLPRDQLVVITGPSGSGKSSLAFDTLYAEGQRRYVESLSAYARQFLSMMEKPDVDHIGGLSPAISIEQKSVSHNPRSTVGTTTEIYDYLRLLYARVGTAYCPVHHHELKAQAISQMVDLVEAQPHDKRYMILAPVVRDRKGEHSQLLNDLRHKGFIRVRIDGHIHELDELPSLDAKRKHNIEVVVDRFRLKTDMRSRLAESLELASNLGQGLTMLMNMEEAEKPLVFSKTLACPDCGFSMPKLEPRLFSFNNPQGACHACDGLGMMRHMDKDLVLIDPRFSLASGALHGWGPEHKYYWQILESVLRHLQIDPQIPWQDLSSEAKHFILHGSGRQSIDVSYDNIRGSRLSRRRTFEGVLPNMMRRYLETESESVKEELGRFISYSPCNQCQGSRLGELARAVKVGPRMIHEITSLSITQAHTFFAELQLGTQKSQIAERILKEIQDRLTFLISVGLNYLSLDRPSETLSGGESQRIRLASQIGSGLVGVMYILDEPSIGLHQRDNQRLLDTLKRLKALGNSVLVVEHDEDAIRQADHVIDMGPGAGLYGGQVIAQGSPEDIAKSPNSLTGQYLSGKKAIEVPKQRQSTTQGYLSIEGASGNNLKDVAARFPIGCMSCITGVSGSGKSTLINETLLPRVHNALNHKQKTKSAPCSAVHGLDAFDKVIAIDQTPIGRTPRSNAATYTGLFTLIRELFASTPEAKARGYSPGRFSFNVRGGRCESCQGEGLLRVEMHFLADVYVTCELCQGKRYNHETLDIHYKGKNIADILSMSAHEACNFFEALPNIAHRIQTLVDVGLGYIQIGQSATTLSGGEAQRVKLSKELAKRATGRTLYVLDEPTTGLHFYDIEQLLGVLSRLRDSGNTILVIEHNLDVIKTADWIVDLGPEGGEQGGEILAMGTPEAIANIETSHTGRFLKDLLKKNKK